MNDKAAPMHPIVQAMYEIDRQIRTQNWATISPVEMASIMNNSQMLEKAIRLAKAKITAEMVRRAG